MTHDVEDRVGGRSVHLTDHPAVGKRIKQRGAHVLATTHYSGLKMYAENESGVLNASVEFDIQTLSPTFRLMIGTPGRSANGAQVLDAKFTVNGIFTTPSTGLRDATGMIGSTMTWSSARSSAASKSLLTSGGANRSNRRSSSRSKPGGYSPAARRATATPSRP